ncbi:MAG: flagellar biosynthesis protein FlhF [Lachnospiraceae bacterium]|nr:flagellar biosynthesis protein FlhF [Lachnospiraceae bacterium]
MIIKKFEAATETEAIMLAKEALGKDAIVMNMKRITPKGIFKLFRKPLVEITAASDETKSYEEEKENSEFLEQLNTQVKKEPVVETSAIEEKLNSLQSMIEKELLAKAKSEDILEREQAAKELVKERAEIAPAADEMPEKNMELVKLVYRQLLSNEVDEQYVNQIMDEIEPTLKKDTTLDMILAAVYQKLVLKIGTTHSMELEEGKTKYIFFIGPTGVGKTTTIAKLASSIVMGRKAKVAMLTSDTYRIAAVEQLRTYANILDVPLKVIYSDTEMEEITEEFDGYDMVFVDTAGRSHKSAEQRDDIERLLSAVPEEDREIYLVLSSTTKYKDLISITERYSEITDYRLIFTKLDETTCIGNIFNIKMLTKAPLSYLTNGQNVPDDIQKTDAQAIAKQLLGGIE